MPIKTERVTSTYEHQLAAAYHYISKRGLLIDVAGLKALETKLVTDLYRICDELSQAWGKKVYIGKIGMPSGDLNLNSSADIIEQIKHLGYKVPRKSAAKGGEETSEQLGLIRLYARTKDENINKIITVSKIKKVLTTYVRAKLYDNSYFCQYDVSATKSGRRGSKKHIFGYGNNAQNWPKYSDFGKAYRRCVIARPGKIFFSVDQKQAEDYPVCALSENLEGLSQLQAAVDRHKKTAAFLFAIPESEVRKYPERFLGKKFRHANNYGMWKNTASDSLAKDGFALTPDECEQLLKRMDAFEPNIKRVFHKYVETKIAATRCLSTPLGRERYFFGLRPKDDNTTIFMEAYSYIPQSTVGDNTGMAVLYIESANEELGGIVPIVQECHDSIVLEIDDNEETILLAKKLFVEAFDREITFHNGITVKIPVEAEFGYNLKDTVSTETAKELLGLPKTEDDMRDDVILRAWQEVRKNREIAKDATNLEQALAGSVS